MLRGFDGFSLKSPVERVRLERQIGSLDQPAEASTVYSYGLILMPSKCLCSCFGAWGESEGEARESNLCVWLWKNCLTPASSLNLVPITEACPWSLLRLRLIVN